MVKNTKLSVKIQKRKQEERANQWWYISKVWEEEEEEEAGPQLPFQIKISSWTMHHSGQQNMTTQSVGADGRPSLGWTKFYFTGFFYFTFFLPCYECFQRFSKPLNGMSENFEMCNFSWTTCVVTNPGTLFHIWLIQHLFCLALPHRATNMAADPTACCFVFVHSGIMSAFRASDFPLVFMPLWTCCAFSVFSSNFAFFFPFIILRTRHVPASRLNLGSEMFAVWL